MNIIFIFILLGLAAWFWYLKREMMRINTARIDLAVKYINLSADHVNAKRVVRDMTKMAVRLSQENNTLREELALSRRATLAMMAKAEERRGLTKNDWLSEAIRR